ncbi:MAG: TolC family protein [Candidatus Binataceae bacterium]|nr:TolC family protein [Candidatus Binataceae bacterium]
MGEIFLIDRNRPRYGFIILAAVYLLIAAIFTFAAPAYAAQVTIEDAVALARQHNPDLALVARELIVSHGELERANYISQFNPYIQLGADYRTRWNSANSQDWQVALAQELEIFGQRKLRRQSAALGYERSGLDLQNQWRLLEAAVSFAFYDSIRTRDQIGLLSELSALDKRLLDAAQARFEAGEIGQIDANLARVRFGESKKALLQGEERYRLQRSSLGRLLGGAAGPEPEPVSRVEPRAELATIEKLLKLARDRRPDLKAAEIEIARLKAESELNRRLARGNPTIGVFGGHELNAEHYMGGQIGFPLPLFNRRQAEATIIAGRTAQASDRQRATELNIEREVRDAYSNYLTARSVLQVNQQDVVEPARESFELLEAAFTAGKMDLLTLSIAERQAFEARMGYIDASFGLMSAEVSLKLATGASQ